MSLTTTSLLFHLKCKWKFGIWTKYCDHETYQNFSQQGLIHCFRSAVSCFFLGGAHSFFNRISAVLGGCWGVEWGSCLPPCTPVWDMPLYKKCNCKRIWRRRKGKYCFAMYTLLGSIFKALPRKRINMR